VTASSSYWYLPLFLVSLVHVVLTSSPNADRATIYSTYNKTLAQNQISQHTAPS
jgi:hypothetical protein